MKNKLFGDYKSIWSVRENTLETLYKYIKDYNISVDGAYNITVSNAKNDGALPVYCCHLDTVHKGSPEPVLIKDDILTSRNEHGIGGDDKCGIVACLELLKKLPCKVIFFRQEEVGCLGAMRYNCKTLRHNKFIIEIDRKGNKDLIYKYISVDMCSDEFKEYVNSCAKDFGYEESNGLYTDVSKLGASGISRMNISAGYYLPHTFREYVVLSELEKTIELCYNIGKNCDKQYAYKVVEVKEEKSYQGPLYVLGATTEAEEDNLPWYKQKELF